MKLSGWQSGLLIMVGFLLAGCYTLQKQVSTGWQTREIAPGVTLFSRHFSSLFDAPQNINMIKIDLNNPDVAIRVAYNDSLLESVSDFARQNHALAAVNGNFFNTKIGGAVCFLKVDGRIVNRTHDELNGTLYLPWLDTAALFISKRDVEINVKQPHAGWMNRSDSCPTIMSAGPLLVWNRKTVSQQIHRFNDKRYSRTGVGLTNDNHLILVAVDGNAAESAGLTTPEFARFFKAIRCFSALNLDGGGSTTMWINDAPGNGVISHPTDNKKYDHYGERKVANAILIDKK